ncbi:hypothetical protein B4N84_05145 [Flavobacterium sp. IR1]|nr:hypothetical protein B4N84_05145 [Flavobacterium sp. IR1]
MQKLYILVLLTFSSLVVGQTGMGTPTPRGALDINRPLTNTFGLVLPTNDDTAKMLNPQGGTIAEGTMMYDSTDKCIKFFDGTAWSDCLGVGSSNSDLTADCTKDGFVGTFERGTTLSGATFKITITNNGKRASKLLSFQTTDLVLSGVSGISVSGVSAASAIIPAGQSVTIRYDLSGTPTGRGTLTGDWSNLGLGCTNTVTVSLGSIRIAYYGDYTIGGSYYPTFNSQLQSGKNYGTHGIYKIKGFVFTNITNTLANLTLDYLQDNYDILCIGRGSARTTDNAKLKAFADAGGVMFVFLENSDSNNLLTTFGFTAPFNYSYGNKSATTNSNSINWGLFGNSTNITLNTFSESALLTAAQLPANSTILAVCNNNPGIFITGSHNTTIFFWDEDLHYHSSVSGTDINTPQEIFLHNLMAYALDKIR